MGIPVQLNRLTYQGADEDGLYHPTSYRAHSNVSCDFKVVGEIDPLKGPRNTELYETQCDGVQDHGNESGLGEYLDLEGLQLLDMIANAAANRTWARESAKDRRMGLRAGN